MYDIIGVEAFFENNLHISHFSLDILLNRRVILELAEKTEE